MKTVDVRPRKRRTARKCGEPQGMSEDFFTRADWRPGHRRAGAASAPFAHGPRSGSEGAAYANASKGPTGERDAIQPKRLAARQATQDAAASARLRRSEASEPRSAGDGVALRLAYERREAMNGDSALDGPEVPKGRGDGFECVHGPRRSAVPEEEPALCGDRTRAADHGRTRPRGRPPGQADQVTLQ
jgi:hypothetical protein